ncbi:MAG: DUF4476 domain-containing protein [Flavisolibacter sp.]
MKNIFTLLAGGLMTVSAFASDVTVTLPGNKNYQVLIDGREINAYGAYGNTISLNNVAPGQHSLQVYKSKGNDRWNTGNAVYSAAFTIRPQYDLMINIDKKGRAQMDERRNNDYGNSGYGGNNGSWGNNNKRDGDDDDAYGRNNRGKHYGQHDRDDRRDGDEDDNGRNRANDHRNGGYNNNGGYGNNDGYGNNGSYDNRNNSYNNAMSDADFNHLVQKIRSQWFGKLNSAKTAVGNNYFNTYQVRQILQIFSSESDKLQLAELAYRNTVDPNNFRQLYDLFSYQGQNALDNYIRNYRY